MELQLALALSLPTNHKKRTSHHHHAPQTLSLLPSTPNHKEDDDAEAIAGWPPVNHSRKKLRVDEVVGTNDHSLCFGQSKPNTLYVKVKMEGVGIARKVDLCMHQSFQTLKETLIHMFAIGKSYPQSNTYDLAYQDKEGDWLHAEDVPWRTFLRCARRLKLLKNSR